MSLPSSLPTTDNLALFNPYQFQRFSPSRNPLHINTNNECKTSLSTTHHIHAPMQLTLQSTNLGLGLLRARILPLPAIIMLGDRYITQGGLCALHMGPRLDTHKLTEALHLIKNHPLHLSNIIDDLEMKVEACWADGFIRRIMPDVQVAVFEGLLDGDALRRVEG
jgi:hypothetical protein